VRIAEQHHASLAPDIEMADPQLLVDERNQLLDLIAAAIGHLEVEGAGDVQAFEVFHPVERDVVVAPAAAHGNRDLVVVFALERPVVDGGDGLDDVDRMNGAIRLDLEES
jgi:hypothetical protein